MRLLIAMVLLVGVGADAEDLLDVVEPAGDSGIQWSYPEGVTPNPLTPEEAQQAQALAIPSGPGFLGMAINKGADSLYDSPDSD